MNEPCLSDEEREAALQLKAHCPKVTSDKEDSDARVARWLNHVNAKMQSLGIHTDHSRGRLFCEVSGVLDVVAESMVPTCNSWIIVSRQAAQQTASVRAISKRSYMTPTKERLAVLSSTGARFVIAEVTETHITLQGWMSRHTLTLRDYAIRYRTEDTYGVNAHCIVRGHDPAHTVNGWGNTCRRCAAQRTAGPDDPIARAQWPKGQYDPLR